LNVGKKFGKLEKTDEERPVLMSDQWMLEIQSVTKRYTDVTALDGVSLKIRPGVIFGLLGPNGAGKTSLIRIITQITAADEGAILFNSQPLKKRHAEEIGYLPEERGLYPDMKILAQLQFLAELHGLDGIEGKKRIKKWLNRFDIEHWGGKKLNELSKGMQQKIQFVATVLHEPKLLIFDEPFTGLDPINTELVKNEIRTLRDQGASIIFSTHRMEQVEEICEEIALINQGGIILSGDVPAIKEQFKKNRFLLRFSNACPEMSEEPFPIIESGDGYLILESAEHHPNEILRYFVDKAEIVHFEELLPSLNEIFIEKVQGVSNE